MTKILYVLIFAAIIPDGHRQTKHVGSNPWGGSNDRRVPDSTRSTHVQVWTQAHTTSSNPFVSTSAAHNGTPGAAPVYSVQQQQPLRQQGFQHNRSHSLDSGDLGSHGWPQHQHLPGHHQSQQQPQKPTLLQMANTPGTFQQQNGSAASASSATSRPVPAASTAASPGVDPFDVAWAAKAVTKSPPNPFGGKQVKQFEVQL